MLLSHVCNLIKGEGDSGVSFSQVRPWGGCHWFLGVINSWMSLSQEYPWVRGVSLCLFQGTPTVMTFTIDILRISSSPIYCTYLSEWNTCGRVLNWGRWWWYVNVSHLVGTVQMNFLNSRKQTLSGLFREKATGFGIWSLLWWAIFSFSNAQVT
jgi:hypothetical protein